MLPELVLSIGDHLGQSFGVIAHFQSPDAGFQCRVDIIILAVKQSQVVVVLIRVRI